MSAVLRLLSRRGCELCEVMLDDLEYHCRGRQVSLEVVDVDCDPGLQRRYGTEIPVLLAGEVEVCRHRLDLAALDKILSV